MKTSFGVDRMEIIRFCARECELQVSGELSVWHMLEAYEYAMGVVTHHGSLPTQDCILTLGSLVEPRENHNGFRNCGIWVGFEQKADWHDIPGLLYDLLEVVRTNTGTPGDWFKLYEDCHPFRDGNGRSGAILFNWWSGTLHKPSWPPDFWNDSRRKPGWGAP